MDPVTLARVRQSCFEKIFAILDADRKKYSQSAPKNFLCVNREEKKPENEDEEEDSEPENVDIVEIASEDEIIVIEKEDDVAENEEAEQLLNLSSTIPLSCDSSQNLLKLNDDDHRLADPTSNQLFTTSIVNNDDSFMAVAFKGTVPSSSPKLYPPPEPPDWSVDPTPSPSPVTIPPPEPPDAVTDATPTITPSILPTSILNVAVEEHSLKATPNYHSLHAWKVGNTDITMKVFDKMPMRHLLTTEWRNSSPKLKIWRCTAETVADVVVHATVLTLQNRTQIKGFLFDCVIEYLQSNFCQHYYSAFKLWCTWAKLSLSMEIHCKWFGPYLEANMGRTTAQLRPRDFRTKMKGESDDQYFKTLRWADFIVKELLVTSHECARLIEDLISIACFLPSVLEYGGFKYYWESYNYMVQHGLTVDGHLKSIIFDIYFSNGDVEMIGNIFHYNVLFGVAVCSTMILGKCLNIFDWWVQEEMMPNFLTMASSFLACVALDILKLQVIIFAHLAMAKSDLKQNSNFHPIILVLSISFISHGKHVLGSMLHQGSESKISLQNTPMIMYSNCGFFYWVLKLFNAPIEMDAISWKALMITCLSCAVRSYLQVTKSCASLIDANMDKESGGDGVIRSGSPLNQGVGERVFLFKNCKLHTLKWQKLIFILQYHEDDFISVMVSKCQVCPVMAILHRKAIDWGQVHHTPSVLLEWKALPPKHGTWKYSSLRTRMFEGAGIVTVINISIYLFT